MAIVRLQFSTKNDFGGALIRYFSHGKYSHVDVVEESGNLYGARSDVLKGIAAGVQSRPFDYATFSAKQFVSIPLTDDQGKLFWEFLYKQRGKPYDSLAIFAFMIGRDWREDDAWFCAEIVAAALEESGYFSH